MIEDIILTILVEFLGPLIAELSIELGIRGSRDVFGKERPENKIFAFISYIFFAAIIASISISIKPHLLIKDKSLQIINLILSPLFAGFIMSYRKKALIAKDKRPIPLDSFLNGFAFAFTFCLMRYLFHK